MPTSLLMRRYQDSLNLAIDQMKDQIIQQEVHKDNSKSEPVEADSTATGSGSRELLNRHMEVQDVVLLDANLWQGESAP